MAEDNLLKEEVNNGVNSEPNVNADVDIKSTDNGQKPVTTSENKAKKLSKQEQEANDFAAMFMETYTVPAVAESMMNKDKFKEIYGDAFVKEFGNKTKASEELDKRYELLSKKYQEVNQTASQFKILDNLAFQAYDVTNMELVSPGSESISGSITVAPETITGEQEFMGTWTAPTRTMREAALKSKQVIDYKGDLISYKENPYDELAHEDAYKDANGNRIKAFTYYMPAQEDTDHPRVNGLAIKAVYEGQEPDGELVSRYDTNNWFLRGNTLDTSTWKVAAGSVFDFIVDTVDTILALGQWQTQLYSLGFAENTSFYKGMKDVRTYLQTWETSKSDADQQSYVTLNNAVGLGINIALQLFSGKLVASGMSSLLKVGTKTATALMETQKELLVAEEALSKMSLADDAAIKIAKTNRDNLLAKFTKQSKKFNRDSNIVKGTTLVFMGAMQAKETGDAAKKAGFSETESALIFFASLGTMALANKISDFGFEDLGMNYNNAIVKTAVNNGMAGVTPTTGGILKAFKVTEAISKNISKGLRSVVNSKGILMGGMREGLEEETEFVLDQVVRHSATALSHLGYDSDDHPKFLTALDKGYWDYFATESLMNFAGGFMAGAGTNLVSSIRRKGKDPERDAQLDWPQEGKTAEVQKFVAYNATRNKEGANLERQLYKHVDKLIKKGALGSHSLSSKWDEKNNRFKRVNELTKEDIAQGHASQAEIQGRAFKAQYEYYKNTYAGSTKTLEELKKEDPDFEFLSNDKTLFEEVRNLFDEKRAIHNKTFGADIDIDARLNELQSIKDKLKPDDNGKVDTKKYDDAMETIIGATKMSKEDVERLMKINSQISDIRSGKAFEIMFLKHYSDKIPFDVLKQLIDTDKKGQSTFKEELKENLKRQAEHDARILEVIEDDNLLLPTLNQLVAENSGDIAFSKEVKEKILERVKNLGISFSGQKQSVLEKILPNLKKSADNLLTFDDKLIHDDDGELTSRELVDQFINDIAEAIEKGPEAVVEAITKNKRIVFAPVSSKDTDGTKHMSRFIYDLKKMLEIASITEETGFLAIKYSTDELPLNIQKALAQHYQDHHASNYDRFNLLLKHPIGDESKTRELFELFNSSADKFLDLLDPYRSLIRIQDLATKQEMKKIIASIETHEDVDVREDLLHGFIKDANGNIVSSGLPIMQLYKQLIEGSTDSEGNVVFFTDAESAREFTDQVQTRMNEIDFLLKIFGILAKVDVINRTKLGLEEGSERTFFTDYVNNYITPLEDMKDQSKAKKVYGTLLWMHDHLSVYLELGNKLIAMASESSEDLNKRYAEQAIKKAKSDVERLQDMFNNVLVDQLEKEPKYKEDIEELKVLLGTLDFDSFTNSNVLAVYDTIAKVKNKLYTMYKDKGFLEFVKASYVQTGTNKTNYEKLLVYMMSGAETFNSYVKQTLQATLEDKVDMANALLPTAEQLSLIETIFVSATNRDYLESIQYFRKIDDNNNNSTSTAGVFVSAQQGSGKTSVVMSIAARLIDIENSKTSPNSQTSGVIFAADNKSQRDNILRNKHKSVKVVKIDNKHVENQYDLYRLLVQAYADNSGDIAKIADRFKDVNAIFYDEVSMLEFDGSDAGMTAARKDPTKASVLGGMLAVIEKINDYRKSNGQAPLVFIGTGDEKQPGYVKGDPTPRNPNSKRSVSDFKKVSVFNSNNRYVVADTISVSFRADVRGMATDIQEFRDTLSVRLKKHTLSYTVTDDGTHLGVRTEKKTFGQIANDEKLIEDILEKLKNDPNFTLGIAVGTGKEPNKDVILGQEDGKNTLLVDKILNHPDKSIRDRVYMYSIESIQGSEHNYVLAYIDTDFFGIEEASSLSASAGLADPVLNKFRAQVDQLAMVLGRARQFVTVGYTGALAGEYIVSEPSKTPLKLIPKTENLAAKQNWYTLLTDGLLKTYGEPTEVPDEKSVDIDEATGEEIIEPITDDTTPKDLNNVLKDSDASTKDQVIISVKPVQGVFQKEEADGDTEFSNDVYSAELAKTIITRIQERYKGRKIKNFTAKEIQALRSKIAKISNKDSIAYEQAQKDLYILDNLNELINGDETNNEVLENITEEIDSRYTPKPSKTKKKATSDAEFMKNVESLEKRLVAFQEFSSSRNDTSPDEVRHTYTRGVYGSQAPVSKEDQNYLADRAIGMDKDNKLSINTDEFDFYFVTYLFKAKNSDEKYPNNVLVAKEKSTGKSFFIAQFSTMDSIVGAPGTLGAQFRNNVAILKGNIQAEDDIIQSSETDGSIIDFIEAKINPDSIYDIIEGMTVGNLVTSDQYTYNIIKKSETPIIENIANMKEGKMLRSKTSDYTFINSIKAFKENSAKDWSKDRLDSWSYTKGESVFEPVPGVGGDGYFIRSVEGSNKEYVVVNTSMGEVPFLLQGGQQALPIIGFHNGEIITTTEFYNRDNPSYINELDQIGNLLKGLRSAEKTKTVPAVTVEGDINQIMNVSKDTVPANSSTDSVKKILLNKFFDRAENFLGNKKLSLAEAHELWAQTGDVPKFSKVCAITRGVHAGKSLLLYTFNRKSDLDSYNEAQIVKLYEDIIANKDEDTELTHDRLGIGFLFLDPVEVTFSQMLDYFPDITSAHASVADFNKAIMTKSNEAKIISMLAHIYSLMDTPTHTKPDNIIRQLKNKMPELADGVEAWYNTIKNDPDVYGTLEAFLNYIFSKDNLGKVELTNYVSEDVMTAIRHANYINTTYANNPSERDRMMGLLFEKFETALSSIEVTSAQTLLSLSSRTSTDSNVSGFIAVNKNNKVVLQKSATTVIHALDEDWAKRVLNNPDGSMIPEPTFNAYNFLLMLKTAARGDKNLTETTLKAMDGLLSVIGIPNGFFVTPTISSTTMPIATVKGTILDVGKMYKTDVKRIRKPQIVIKTDKAVRSGALSTVVKTTIKQDASENIKDKHENRNTAGRDFSLQIISSLPELGISYEEHDALIKEVTKALNSNTIDKQIADELYKQIIDNFNSYNKKIVYKNKSDIDFSKLVLKVPGTEEFIDALNVLRDLSVSKSMSKYIWSELLSMPSNLTAEQIDMIKTLASKIQTLSKSKASISQEEAYDITSELFKNKALNKLNLVVNNSKSLERIRSQKEAMLGGTLTFPISFESSPEQRVQFLLDIHSVDGNGNPMYSDKDINDKVVTDTFTRNPADNRLQVELWVDKALKVGTEPLIVIPSKEILSIINDKNNFAFRNPYDIAAALTQLRFEGRFDEYIELLDNFKKEVDDIYYNKGNTSYTNLAYNNAIELIKVDSNKDVVESKQIENINENMIITEELNKNNDQTFIENIMQSKLGRKLHADSSEVFNDVVDIFKRIQQNGELADVIKYIKSDYTEEELAPNGLRSQTVARLLDYVTNKYLTRPTSKTESGPFFSKLSGKTPLENMQLAAEFFSDLSRDEDLRCFV